MMINNSRFQFYMHQQLVQDPKGWASIIQTKEQAEQNKRRADHGGPELTPLNDPQIPDSDVEETKQ